MITYMIEPWSACWPELQPLWDAHWQEVAINRDSIKLAIDFDSYASFEANGSLQVMVAREDGAVIGYHLSMIRPHLHYVHDLHAFTDVYFISKDHRKGSVGVQLFREVEKAWKARGVKKAFTGTKLHLDMSKLFEHLGWTETERLFTKVLGGV